VSFCKRSHFLRGLFLLAHPVYTCTRSYISRLCYDVSVRLSVRLSVTEVHWCIIANLGFKFRSQFTAHCGRGACGREGRDHRREEWRDHLALCQPLLGPVVIVASVLFNQRICCVTFTTFTRAGLTADILLQLVGWLATATPLVKRR